MKTSIIPVTVFVIHVLIIKATQDLFLFCSILIKSDAFHSKILRIHKNRFCHYKTFHTFANKIFGLVYTEDEFTLV